MTMNPGVDPLLSPTDAAHRKQSIPQPAMGSRNQDVRRERIYRLAVALSIIFVIDGTFMAWALLNGAYAFLGYGKLSYFPVFMPAFLVGLVVTGIYVHGFVRLSWTSRKAEWLFFFLFADAVAAKIIVVVHRHCCG